MRNQRQIQRGQFGVKAVTTRISRVNVLRRWQPLDGARTARRRSVKALKRTRVIRVNRRYPLEILGMTDGKTGRIIVGHIKRGVILQRRTGIIARPIEAKEQHFKTGCHATALGQQALDERPVGPAR